MRLKKPKRKANMFGHSVAYQPIDINIITPEKGITRPLLMSIKVGMIKGVWDQKYVLFQRIVHVDFSPRLPQGVAKTILDRFFPDN